jgi:Ca2+/H+ antiporter
MDDWPAVRSLLRYEKNVDVQSRLTLSLDPFATITLFVAVVIVNFALSDGWTTYFEGA